MVNSILALKNIMNRNVMTPGFIIGGMAASEMIRAATDQELDTIKYDLDLWLKKVETERFLPTAEKLNIEINGLNESLSRIENGLAMPLTDPLTIVINLISMILIEKDRRINENVEYMPTFLTRGPMALIFTQGPPDEDFMKIVQDYLTKINELGMKGTRCQTTN